MLQQAVDDAGAVEPGGDRESPRDGGGLEQADLLHPPDGQLQVRAARDQRVQVAFGAPGQIAAQIGFGVLTGGALETGQVGGSCEPQLISDRRQTIRWEEPRSGKFIMPRHCACSRPPRRRNAGARLFGRGTGNRVSA